MSNETGDVQDMGYTVGIGSKQEYSNTGEYSIKLPIGMTSGDINPNDFRLPPGFRAPEVHANPYVGKDIVNDSGTDPHRHGHIDAAKALRTPSDDYEIVGYPAQFNRLESNTDAPREPLPERYYLIHNDCGDLSVAATNDIEAYLNRELEGCEAPQFVASFAELTHGKYLLIRGDVIMPTPVEVVQRWRVR